MAHQMPSFFRKLQLIIVLLLICDSYMSGSTRFVSLKLHEIFHFRFRLVFIKIYIFFIKILFEKFVADIIKFSNFLLQLKNQRSQSRTVCGFCIILILKEIITF